MNNKRGQSIPIKVYKGLTYIETIQRQINKDARGYFCQYNGQRHTVTRIERVTEHAGTKVEYQFAI